MHRKIVLFELNEVPFRIITEFCQAHPRSVLARHLPGCWQYETFTQDQGQLSPWITWPTLHRGVSNDRHYIGNFGQDLSHIDREYPPLWRILTSRGVQTGICGSLHTYPVPSDLSNYAFYLPDAFAAGSECFPSNASAFQAFQLRLARESARNVSLRIPWKSAWGLLARAPSLGFKAQTFAAVGEQLVSERVQAWRRVRRRTYQAVLAFDVFMKQLERAKPDFVTFFTNHVASSMHRYWAAAFPEDYDRFDFTPDWVKTFRNEIDFTMSKFDRLFFRLVKFADDNPTYQVWVATSMGQAATVAKPVEAQLYCVNPQRFMAAMGIMSSEWCVRPAMLPQFNVSVVASRVAHFRRALRTLYVDSRRIAYRECENGFFSLDLGHDGLFGKPPYAFLDGSRVRFEEIGLKVVEIEDKSGCSAYHIPNGSLVIYDPQDRGLKPGNPQISTLEIAPTLLKNFSIPIPPYMQNAVPLASGALGR